MWERTEGDFVAELNSVGASRLAKSVCLLDLWNRDLLSIICY